jgi:hypothetical protein
MKNDDETNAGIQPISLQLGVKASSADSVP